MQVDRQEEKPMRKIPMKKFVRAALAWAGAACVATAVIAQPAFPSRPLKLIVPFPAGGSSDILGRAFAEKIQAELGQAVVVDNRAGGNTVIGTQAAASAKPDGYTILQVTPNAVIVGSLQANLPYDLERDFTPVIGVGAVPLLLAVPAMSNIRSVADLVAVAKTSASGATYASGGIGSLGHLVPARLMRELGATGTHVPYRGVAPAIQDVAAGRVNFMFVSTLEGMQMTKSGMIRVLGVTSERRLRSLPEVPTMAELGFPDFNPAVWYGFVVPANTPPAVTDRLAKAFAKAADDPAMRERLMALGLSVDVRDSAAFGKYLREETVRWSRVVKDNNIRME
jgi:tripartite-type tricarboxylate transporter receptor subunit TctC